MRTSTKKKLAEFCAALMVMIPCVLLLAWGSVIADVWVYWMILTLTSGIFLAALFLNEQRNGVTWQKFILKQGGFCIMFAFILYQFLETIA